LKGTAAPEQPAAPAWPAPTALPVIRTSAVRAVAVAGRTRAGPAAKAEQVAFLAELAAAADPGRRRAALAETELEAKSACIPMADGAGILAGRREAFERVAALIRQSAAAWRAEEAKRGRIKAAFLWASTELWLARLEGIALALDQQVNALRTQEAAGQKAPPAPKTRGKAKNRR
jgi:hypothetical protein